MELIISIVLAGPLGYLAPKRGLLIYLVIWAVVLPIQTIVVHSENPMTSMRRIRWSTP
jgi:hypothetical protein